ncbi:tyrosine-type recombinase/integrase [Phytohabitans aurantiacus]|uniref:Tyr recombinase domain-containing protein n=1 Tax=Phytohabitans aurantiacus TaxID=3016789 RepID=A0ABQ5QSU5_9ACTN|nr:site-specific integrase [Phytohabitans aurantiacus]GLH97322.1 hypothetical protein Pa4123_25970 [Phytohabitans aurantiacus]
MPPLHPKQRRPNAGRFQPLINSFALALRAVGRSERTVFTYTDAAVLYAGWLLREHPHLNGWEDAGRDHLRGFLVWIQNGGDPCPHWFAPETRHGDAPAWRMAEERQPCTGYGKAYVNQLARSLQQFGHFLSEEEDMPEMFDRRVKVPPAPKMTENPVPVLTPTQLATLIKDAESKRDFPHRRDAAILHLFRATGCRLAEIVGMSLDHVDLSDRSALVTGKADKTRRVRFDHACARAIDRYLRVRPRHPAQHLPALWLGVRRRQAMTISGLYQLVERRGARLGIKIHPHMFRHGFADAWIDNGGTEGDLMELMGWDSTQMLQRYGRAVRARRAARAYDRVMGG